MSLVPGRSKKRDLRAENNLERGAIRIEPQKGRGRKGVV